MVCNVVSFIALVAYPEEGLVLDPKSVISAPFTYILILLSAVLSSVSKAQTRCNQDVVSVNLASVFKFP